MIFSKDLDSCPHEPSEKECYELVREDTNQGIEHAKKRLPIGSLFRIIKIKKLYVLVQHHRHHQHEYVFAFVLLGWNDHSRFVGCRHIEPDLIGI